MSRNLVGTLVRPLEHTTREEVQFFRAGVWLPKMIVSGLLAVYSQGKAI